MMKKFTIIVVFALFCTAAAFAEDSRVEMPRLEIPTSQSAGFGGSHIAYTDNVFSLLVNPAAMMRVNQRSAFALSFTLVSPEKSLKLISNLKDMDAGAALESLNNPNNPGKIPFGVEMNEFPLSIGYVANGFGFGLWDRVFVSANVNGTTAEATVIADVILPIGFAFRILDTEAHDVDVGATLKFFGRGYGNKVINVTEVVGDFGKLTEDLGAPVILGAGFDLGFLYRWNIGLSAGITFDDIITGGTEISRIGEGEKKDGYYVPFSLNLGVAYDLRIGNFWKNAPRFIANSGVAVAFDWRNFELLFETENPYLKRNPVLGIGVGLQFSFLEILKVRLGMNEMLPAFGLGFDLGSLEIDVAYYGKELGIEPGQMSAAALSLTFAIRPESKAKTWPWAKTSLVEVIASQGRKSNAQTPKAASVETPAETPASPAPAVQEIPELGDETAPGAEVIDDIAFENLAGEIIPIVPANE
jgi:hypothetical protein